MALVMAVFMATSHANLIPTQRGVVAYPQQTSKNLLLFLLHLLSSLAIPDLATP